MVPKRRKFRIALDAYDRMFGLVIASGLGTVLVVGSPFIESLWFDTVISIAIGISLIVAAWPAKKKKLTLDEESSTEDKATRMSDEGRQGE